LGLCRRHDDAAGLKLRADGGELGAHGLRARVGGHVLARLFGERAAETVALVLGLERVDVPGVRRARLLTDLGL